MARVPQHPIKPNATANEADDLAAVPCDDTWTWAFAMERHSERGQDSEALIHLEEMSRTFRPKDAKMVVPAPVDALNLIARRKPCR